MTITAKYRGTCKSCGGKILVGTQIEWDKKSGSRHVDCAGATEAQPNAGDAAATITIYGGSGYGDNGWVAGQVLINPGQRWGSTVSQRDAADLAAQTWLAEHPAPTTDALWAGAPPPPYETANRPATHYQPGGYEAALAAWKEETNFGARAAAYQVELAAHDAALRAVKIEAAKAAPRNNGPVGLVVISASRRYHREDGMSFGVGDEEGYTYEAKCRPATTDEIRPLVDEICAAAYAAKSRAELIEIAKQIQTNGERPEKLNSVEGKTVCLDPRNLYGGGHSLVIGEDWIYDVLGNGADGDDWSYNNYNGSIVRRVPYDSALAARVLGLAARVV